MTAAHRRHLFLWGQVSVEASMLYVLRTKKECSYQAVLFSVFFACWKYSVKHTYGTPKLTLWLAPGTTVPISLRPHKTRSIHLPNMYLRKPPCQFSGNSPFRSKICNPIRSELCCYSQRRTRPSLHYLSQRWNIHHPPHTIYTHLLTRSASEAGLHRKMKTNPKRNHTQHCHT